VHLECLTGEHEQPADAVDLGLTREPVGVRDSGAHCADRITAEELR